MNENITIIYANITTLKIYIKHHGQCLYQLQGQYSFINTLVGN